MIIKEEMENSEQVSMSKKNIILICLAQIAVILITIFAVNMLLIDLMVTSNLVCANQTFSSAEEAIAALETRERTYYDESLKCCPPYSVKYCMDYDENVIVFFSYCDTYDGTESQSYAIRILNRNDDGTFSFDHGVAEFRLEEPDWNMGYHYFTDIATSKGRKSISFLYLPQDSEKNVYVDGNKCEKVTVSIDEKEFYLCYAISKRDTFLENFFLSVSERHTVEVK